MKLKEFHERVAARADTPKTKIGAADVSRVLSEAFGLLAELDACEATDLVSQGLGQARKKAMKANPAPPVATE